MRDYKNKNICTNYIYLRMRVAYVKKKKKKKISRLYTLSPSLSLARRLYAAVLSLVKATYVLKEHIALRILIVRRPFHSLKRFHSLSF